MSFYEYEEGKEIAAQKPSFYALIQAAMRRADDSDNLELLQDCWPDVWADLFERYYSPGGKLKGELKGDKK